MVASPRYYYYVNNTRFNSASEAAAYINSNGFCDKRITDSHLRIMLNYLEHPTKPIKVWPWIRDHVKRELIPYIECSFCGKPIYVGESYVTFNDVDHGIHRFCSTHCGAMYNHKQIKYGTVTLADTNPMNIPEELQ